MNTLYRLRLRVTHHRSASSARDQRKLTVIFTLGILCIPIRTNLLHIHDPSGMPSRTLTLKLPSTLIRQQVDQAAAEKQLEKSASGASVGHRVSLYKKRDKVGL